MENFIKSAIEKIRLVLTFFTKFAFELILAGFTPLTMLIKHATILVLISWCALSLMSGKWTYNALINTNDWIWALIGTAAIEGTKNCLYSKRMDTAKKDMLKDLAVYSLFVVISVMASMSDIYGQSNKDTNTALVNSIEYKDAEAKKSSIDKQIALKTDRLNSINSNTATKAELISNEESKKSTIKEYDAKIKSVNDKITAKRNELKETPLTTRTQRLRNDIQSEINEFTNQRKSWEEAKKQMQSSSSNLVNTENTAEVKQLLNDIDRLTAEKNAINVSVDSARVEGGFGNIPVALRDFFWFCSLSLKTWMVIWAVFLSAGIEFGMLRMYNKLKNEGESERSIVNIANRIRESIVGISPDITSKANPIEIKAKLENRESLSTTKKDDIKTNNEMSTTNMYTKPMEIKAKLEKHESLSTTKNDDLIKNSESLSVSNKNDERLSTTNMYTKKDLAKWINYIYGENEDNEKSPGYQKTRKILGFGEQKALAITGHLKHLGILRVDGSNTYILCSKEEAFERIKNSYA